MLILNLFLEFVALCIFFIERQLIPVLFLKEIYFLSCSFIFNSFMELMHKILPQV